MPAIANEGAADDARDPRAVTTPPIPTGRPASVGVGVGAFLLTVIVRLVPMLRGGGLRGYGSYDDSVYYASAVGLVHGRLPYRDFLLLQPPGIVLLLAPFAALGRLVGEADGMALARLAWMITGGLTAVGIVVLLLPLGRIAAGTGAAVYALSWPAALVERVTDLEAPQNLALVAALLLLRPKAGVRSTRARTTFALIAGLLLGLSTGVKIWGILSVVVLAGWLVISRRFRDLTAMVAGVVVAAGAVYLPFFLASPRQMWQMVVLDQLGRRRLGTGLQRLEVLTGTTQLAQGHRQLLIVGAAVAVMIAAVILGWLVRGLRPVVVIYAVHAAALLLAPPVFVHYGALVAVPTAMLIGAAVAVLARTIASIGPAVARRALTAVLAAVIVAALVTLAYPQAKAKKETAMPARIARTVRHAAGCVTFDTPSPALAIGVVGRNLARGCPLVVDLGGASYQPALATRTARAHDRAWQPYAVTYLGSGSIAIIDRFSAGFGFSPATAGTIARWPLLARHGHLQLRRPPR